MKKFLSAILALAMMFSLMSSQVAFAADATVPTADATVQEDEGGIQPYGSLSGYGETTISSGTKSGEFTVPVRGVAWLYAQLTFRIEGFDSKTRVRMSLYRPNGSLAWGTAEYPGGFLSMEKPEIKNQTFADAVTGNYALRFEVFTYDGSTPSGGKIICHVY